MIKNTKNERCAQWILEILKEYKGWISLMELVELGGSRPSIEREEGYSRQNLYNALKLLRGKVVTGGHGRMAIWYTKEKFEAEGRPIGVIAYQEAHS